MPTSFKGNPRFYQISCFGGLIDSLDIEQLNKRGWTLQERYLSPRVVHYGKDQLFFEYEGGIIAEDGSRFQVIFQQNRYCVTGAGNPVPGVIHSLRPRVPKMTRSIWIPK